MNGKQKSESMPPASGRTRTHTHHLHLEGLSTPDIGSLPLSSPTRRFRIGWTPSQSHRDPHENLMPSIYVIDRGPDVLLRAVMSGVYKTDLDLLVSADSVHIRGRVRHKDVPVEGEYCFSETFSETFFRRVYLPGEIDSSRVTAEFDDDVLEMTLPKIPCAG